MGGEEGGGGGEEGGEEGEEGGGGGEEGGGAGVVTPSVLPPPANNFCLHPLSNSRCFLKDSLMTPTTPLQAPFTATPTPSTTTPP